MKIVVNLCFQGREANIGAPMRGPLMVAGLLSSFLPPLSSNSSSSSIHPPEWQFSGGTILFLSTEWYEENAKIDTHRHYAWSTGSYPNVTASTTVSITTSIATQIRIMIFFRLALLWYFTAFLVSCFAVSM